MDNNKKFELNDEELEKAVGSMLNGKTIYYITHYYCGYKISESEAAIID